jgi:hypothetical protein
MGLRVYSAVRHANDQATRALLGVYLEEVLHPEQVLQAPPPWLELVANNKLPKDLDNPHACSKELAEEPCLRQLQPNLTRHLVLEVLGNVGKVWQLLVGTDQVNG